MEESFERALMLHYEAKLITKAEMFKFIKLLLDNEYDTWYNEATKEKGSK